ncbi:hypothetical protein Taro_009226 [Colocasia esculenta]|uniref:BTB/POZ domain-containing protein FBL11 n=1 Tax=Colocasia esculenta TaxID=4460 RepID=A0A843U549_COLES|nr:hypothetical protein [Colocasia esculenta]
MTSGAVEDMVFLVLTDPSDVAAEEEGEPEEITVLTSEIHSWDVPRLLHSRVVRVHASRSDLIQGSSYFRSLLGGSFSESGFSHVSVQFNLRAAISVLQCLCGCPVDVEPENFLLLLEGALFFGVEVLLSECKAWFQNVTSIRAVHSLQISVDAVIEIWNYSVEHGISFVSEMCTAYLAQNFVVIGSEKQLCEALLLWVSGNGKSSRWSFASEKDHINILKKVRVMLLPLAYSAGKRRSYYFSSLAKESINAIFDLMGEIPTRLSRAISYNNSNLKIRLTQYSEKVDLSGCVHLMVDLLYLAVLPSDMDSVSRRQMIQTLIEDSHQFGANYHISRKLPMPLTFIFVSEVDMSKCPNLHFGALINFLCVSFPSLQILKLSYCSHFKIEDLFFLLQNCPSINDLDLTVDISHIIPTQVSVSSTNSEEYQALGVSPYTRLQHQSMMSRIAKLTLEGRTDLDGKIQKDIKCCLEISDCIYIQYAFFFFLLLLTPSEICVFLLCLNYF